MRIETRSKGLPALELETHVDERLRRALGRFAGKVRHVGVVLRDLNGPRGGEDIHCRIQVTLAPGGTLVVEDVRATPFAAVAAAANRARARVARALCRTRRHR